MELEKFLICAKCAILFNSKEAHFENCLVDEPIINYKDGKNISCYTCGREDVDYSQSELEKKEFARCIKCESNCQTKRCYKYDYLWTLHTEQVHKLDINRQLLFYTKEFNIEKVKELLEAGANPNIIFKQYTIRGWGYHYVLCYNFDGSIINNKKSIFLSSLHNCIEEFRWADNDNFKNKIIHTAKILLDFGAEKEKNKELFESYLGKFAEEDGLKYTFYSLFE